MSKMKNTLDGINRSHTVGEKISELEKKNSRNYTQWNTDSSIYDTEMKTYVQEKGCTQMFRELHL